MARLELKDFCIDMLKYLDLPGIESNSFTFSEIFFFTLPPSYGYGVYAHFYICLQIITSLYAELR